ncbi:MAG: transcriptional regulator [Cyanobacteria bacterium RYN_339]|nr:transcriptional regulator [Cyanobacteria bacterium RYN_339]
MKRDSRLSLVLHLLLHMAHSKRPMTSEEMGTSLQTNSVVVRRTLAGLREAGWIHSEKGHGGGWSLACDLDAITLRDIHKALGEPPMLAMGLRNDDPACLVEQVVNQVIDQALREAEAMVLEKFSRVTLAELSTELGRRAPHGRQEHLDHG